MGVQTDRRERIVLVGAIAGHKTGHKSWGFPASPKARVRIRSIHSATNLDGVAQELNDRPRKRLEFRQPIEGLLLQ
jgi:hypothetical protein